MPTEEIPERIIKEGDRVATIVRSLLSFAREDDKKKKTSLNVQEVLEEVLALTKAQIDKDGISLKIDFPSKLPKIFGNFQQIEQVFLNIINNARYALNQQYPQTSPNKKLIIHGSEEIVDGRQHIEVTFIDYGIGIPTEVLDKIYNPFFSTKPSGKGTGLGLAISHGIISDHGGKLIFESNEDEYTKVLIFFPAITENA
jgi:signal transduction histidine kinase